jgi:thymidine phosphorylase
MDLTPFIERKRDGLRLEDEDWSAIVPAIAGGRVAEVQIGAWLMAVYLRGLDTRERAAYTREMIATGTALDWSERSGPVADKHSTGGVGDKVSLIWAPLVAAAGAAVPMISGRGLGHTGGTLDKLEAIPGYDVVLDPAGIAALLDEAGCVICGQTETMVPADRILYDRRNLTGTVATVDHIAPSIMSKKLSEGLDRLVLDVKVGRGAFMKTLDDARQLAQVMVDLGSAVGCRTSALLTTMDRALGRWVGHGAEVHEALELLEGRGPADTRQLVLALAEEVVPDADLEALLASGEPRERFARMVHGQGGRLDEFRWPIDARPHDVCSRDDGVIVEQDALTVGHALADLGGARTDQDPDLDVAVELLRKPGDTVRRGEPWARLWHRDGRGLERAEARLVGALRIAADGGEIPVPLIHERVKETG